MGRRRSQWTRARVIATIETYRVEGRSLALGRVPMGLVKAAAESFGSYQAALDSVASKPAGAIRGRHWSRPKIIAAIRDVVARTGFVSRDPNLCAVARRYFGSVPAAAKAAGIDVRRHRSWTRNDVLAELQAIHRREGRVTIALTRQAGVRGAITKYFGGIAGACEAAGLAGFHKELRREHAAQDSRRELVGRLREIATKLDHPVQVHDLPSSLHAALLRRFGGLHTARDAAKLPHPEPPRLWTRERIVAELRREHRRGTHLTTGGLRTAGRGDLLSAIKEIMKSIVAARRIAGVPEPKRLQTSSAPFVKIWDEHRVIDEIKVRVRAELPLAPSKVPGSLLAAACVYLGSWREAVEAAGCDYDGCLLRRRLEDDELLGRLRALARHEPEMTLRELAALPIGKLAYGRFGTPERAAASIGIRDWPKRHAHTVRSREQLHRLLRARIGRGESLAKPEVLEALPELRQSMLRVHPVWEEALVRLGLGAHAPAAKHPRPRAASHRGARLR